ncbi:MAG: acetyl-CoA carboxylase biotin carboxyl carrier protein [Candidatus Hydrogenedentes bacterium]|nr:acetyl-CoA carboxylase biotin carboxyl carrier protein [Candidatus Hydrogenedentota bacterium]
MDIAELQKLIRVLESSGLSELEIEENGRRIRLAKNAAPLAMFAPQGVAGPLVVPGAPGVPGAHAGEEAATPAPAEAEHFPTIDSPMVGTFYASPAPGDPPFVVIGDPVEVDQTVCIIEAMKIMNEVTAKFAGTIEKVLVDNGEPVEFGQPLFALRPLE